MNEAVAQKIEDFFAQYRVLKYPKGQVLILSGEQTTFVYNLVKGKVKQYDVTYRGDEIILNIFKPPAFFPMSTVINKVENPYIFEAETAVEVRKAPAEEVIAFIQENPDVLFDLLSRVYRGVDALLGRLGYLMAGSASSRLAYELLIEARRFGEATPDGGSIITITEKDLGARAGLSRETVSREMGKLKAADIIAFQSNAIVIKHPSMLEKKLGHEL